MTRWLLVSAFAFTFGGSLHAEVKVERIDYKGWHDCYRVTNGEVELVITADVGPRIIRFAFVGGQNVFKEFPDQLGKTNEKQFQLRGGARVWKAPEDPVATWAPDNVPVEISVTSNGLVATAPVEPLTQLQKQLEITMADRGTQVRVVHRIVNRGLFPLQYSAWAITMMAPGGLAISGFPPRGKHPEKLEPTNPLVMWAYTNLSDRRWLFTRKYLTLRQDASLSEPQKLGMFNPESWGAYLLNGEAFLKRASVPSGLAYPDFGCSLEFFTNNEFLEMETLGPLTTVPPGKSAEQVEHWSLHRDVRVSELSDESLETAILPLLRMPVSPN